MEFFQPHLSLAPHISHAVKQLNFEISKRQAEDIEGRFVGSECVETALSEVSLECGLARISPNLFARRQALLNAATSAMLAVEAIDAELRTAGVPSREREMVLASA